MLPDTTLQNYQFIRLLGEGGMGEVWLAEHTHLGRQVAVKCLHPQLLRNAGIKARFKQEATTLARLQHPGIVALHDYIEQDGAAYLVMEYVEGMPLDAYILQKSGPIPDGQLRELFNQILNAFAYAHGRKVVHRDIKPSNFMLTPDGRIKVLDFGIAKVLEQTDHKLTMNGARMGTVLYMSPEQVKGTEIDQRSDIYSLGVLLFQMATGKCPYNSDTTEFVVYEQIVNHPLPTPSLIYPGVTTAIEGIIARATAKRPEDRFQDCAAFVDAMSQADYPGPPFVPGISLAHAQQASNPMANAAQIGAQQASPQKPRKSRLKSVVTALVLLLGIGLLALFYLRGVNNERDRDAGIGNSDKGNSTSDVDSRTKADAEKRRKDEEKQRKDAEERDRVDSEKKAIRQDFDDYIKAGHSEYSYGLLGGISGLSVTVSNSTEYRIDQVDVQVSYIQANAEIYTVETLTFHDIRQNDSKTLKAPDTARGTSVAIAITSIQSKELQLCFDAEYEFEGADESTYSVPNDPYHCPEQ